MAMDYSKFAGLPGGYVVNSADTPLDGRLIVNDITDINEIPMPYIGLMVYVTNEEKYYTIKSLKSSLRFIMVKERFLDPLVEME